MPVDDLIAQLAQPPVNIVHPVLLIRINQGFTFGMSALALYEQTRGVWLLGERREQAKYALAVYDGLVREVYRIDAWHPGGTTPYTTRQFEADDLHRRWEFTGEITEDAVGDYYLRKSVRAYLPRHMQCPVKYVNC